MIGKNERKRISSGYCLSKQYTSRDYLNCPTVSWIVYTWRYYKNLRVIERLFSLADQTI